MNRSRHPLAVATLARLTGASVALGLLPGCIPTQRAYLALPVHCPAALRDAPVVIELPYAQLAAGLPDGFDRRRLAFFDRGSEPVPSRTVDRDGDGVADGVLVRLGPGPEPRYVTVLSPGPRAVGAPPAGPPTPGVRVDWAHGRR